jgi:hypothetical protein
VPEKPDFALRCSHCDRFVTGAPHGGYTYLDDNFDEWAVAVVECPKCRGPHLVRHLERREKNFAGEFETSFEALSIVYPSREVTLDSSVPKNVAKSYLEAHRTFHEARAYTATAMMCRRTLETICVEFGAGKRNLVAKLTELKEKGIIENRLYEWSNDVLRALGNEAAHGVQDDIPKDDAKDALEFTRALIEYLYVFQAAYERFKKRRAEASEQNVSENTGSKT